jgi:hypothetical protein
LVDTVHDSSGKSASRLLGAFTLFIERYVASKSYPRWLVGLIGSFKIIHGAYKACPVVQPWTKEFCSPRSIRGLASDWFNDSGTKRPAGHFDGAVVHSPAWGNFDEDTSKRSSSAA